MKVLQIGQAADLREILKERTEAGATIYGEIRAAAESGWDFSSRWLRGDGLETTRTRDIIPVDLNAFLYKAERRLADVCLSWVCIRVSICHRILPRSPILSEPDF